jgi:hypothetical protein
MRLQDIGMFVGDCRKHGVQIVQLAQQYEEPEFYIPYGSKLGNHFHRPLPDPLAWFYLSPVARRWLRLIPFDRDAVYLRAGWTLCRQAGRNSWKFYYLDPQANDLIHIDIEIARMANGEKAILKGYGAIQGNKNVGCAEDQNHFYLFWPDFAIPPAYEKYLIRWCCDKQKLEGGRLLIFYPTDRQMIERIMRALRFNLVQHDTGINWVGSYSQILEAFYAIAFRNIVGRFTSVGRPLLEIADSFETRAPEAAGALRDLTRLAHERTNNSARQVRKCLKTCIEYCYWPDPKASGKEGFLRGVILEGADVEWMGKKTPLSLYRIAFPDIGITASWRTTLLRESVVRGNEAIRFSGTGLFMPVFGYIRTQKNTDWEILPAAGRALREQITWSFAGIPSVEKELLEAGSLHGYALDYSQERWLGYKDLTRFIYLTGKVIRRSPANTDFPSLLVRDCMEKEFLLETSCISPKDAEGLPGPGDMIGCLARISVRDLLEYDFPLLHLAGRGWLRPHVTDAVAERMALLSAIKYLYDPHRRSLDIFFYGTDMAGIIDKRLKEIVEEDKAVLNINGNFYWKYPLIREEGMRHIVEDTPENEEQQMFQYLRYRLHPQWAIAAPTPNMGDFWTRGLKKAGLLSDEVQETDKDLEGDQ